MGKAFSMFWETLATLFTATNHAAKAINNVAEYADEASGVWADEARRERNTKLKAIAADTE